MCASSGSGGRSGWGLGGATDAQGARGGPQLPWKPCGLKELWAYWVCRKPVPWDLWMDLRWLSEREREGERGREREEHWLSFICHDCSERGAGEGTRTVEAFFPISFCMQNQGFHFDSKKYLPENETDKLKLFSHYLCISYRIYAECGWYCVFFFFLVCQREDIFCKASCQLSLLWKGSSFHGHCNQVTNQRSWWYLFQM